MKNFKPGLGFWGLPLFLLAVSCTSDSGNGNPSTGSSAGSFQVSLVEPTAITPGYTTVLGKVYTGPTPSSIIWKEVGSSGSCRLFTPRAPFCEKGCGSDSTCVEDNKCQVFPKSIGVGKVGVKGLKAKSGATTFSMDPILNSYQQPGTIQLEFPPSAEGDEITFSAAGDTSVPAFTVSAPGISPLVVLADSFTFVAGKPITLEWTPPKNAGASRVSVLVDLSHHGGTKGKIECEGPDNGKLEIPATLANDLKALGISGFPKIEIARKSTGTNAKVHVDLVIQAMLTKALSIPGLISCNDENPCPSGQTCQRDLRCQ